MHRMTDMLAECFNEAARPHTMILIEEAPDGGSEADRLLFAPLAPPALQRRHQRLRYV
jgi:4-oxalocrotonate tautomerase